MAKKKYITIEQKHFIELLREYAKADETIIWEYSGNFDESFKGLQDEIREYKKVCDDTDFQKKVDDIADGIGKIR